MEIETRATEARSRSAEQFVVRLPDGMRTKIKELSVTNRRSMNAQIVMLLEQGIKRQAQGAQQ
ncbi:Arc family DNA-binding protein [Variovorax sp. PvP013]|uniref:Arc family DNA-binding protein n=1 Tax=Variovorax sp. PvP013 TaxID=3156435 RepID=UPI003D23463E